MASGQQSLKAVHRSSQKQPKGVPPPQRPSQEIGGDGGDGGDGGLSRHSSMASGQQSLNAVHRSSQKQFPTVLKAPQKPSH